MTKLRPELESMPLNMLALPIDERGYPIPWFVAEVDGVRDFRIMDPIKRRRAHTEQRCWVCGQRRGANFTFVVGPMCAVNHISAEPPSHKFCAEWSARNCPFLARPHMVRRDNDLPDELQSVPGMIPRNPGVALLWSTRSYKLRPQEDTFVFLMGEPMEVSWWCQGRPATFYEVQESMDSGLPLLMESCGNDKGLIERMKADYQKACELLPKRTA